MALEDWQRVGADRMVSNALRVFDMRDDPDRVRRERNLLARSARIYGDETLAFAIDRCGGLLDVNPRDEMAARALELLTEVRDELGAGAP